MLLLTEMGARVAAEVADEVAARVADEMPDKITDEMPLLTEMADEMTALLEAHHLLLYTGRDQCGGAAGTLILLIKTGRRLKIIQRPKNGKEIIEIPLVNGCDCLPQHHPHPRHQAQGQGRPREQGPRRARGHR